MQPPSPDQNSFLYPNSIENACWASFISSAFDAEDSDVEYVPIQNRSEHQILPYPSGGMLVKMQLLQLNDTCVTLLFEHYYDNPGETAPCVRTEKTIACVRRFQTRLLPTKWPEPIRDQLNLLGIAERGVSGARRLRLLRRIRSLFTSSTTRG